MKDRRKPRIKLMPIKNVHYRTFSTNNISPFSEKRKFNEIFPKYIYIYIFRSLRYERSCRIKRAINQKLFVIRVVSGLTTRLELCPRKNPRPFFTMAANNLPIENAKFQHEIEYLPAKTILV